MHEKAQKMLKKYPLCNHCLGRQFAFLGHGMSNKKRGEVIKLILAMKGHQLVLLGKKAGFSILKSLATNGSFDMATEILKRMRKRVGKKRECYLCKDRFQHLDELVFSSVKELGAHECATFLVGIELPIEIKEKEDEFKAEFEVRHGESMQNEFSRDIGKEIIRLTDKNAEYKKPDAVIIIKPFTGQVTLQANPLYIEGRYRKLIRGIPQSKWACARCRGEGCPKCNWTGKMYLDSIEEIIAKPVLEKTGGEDAAFHAAGREDLDTLMLGQGRPYILEVKKPKRRFLDLIDLTQSINEQANGKIEIQNLRFADKDAVRKLKKKEGSDKIYRAIIKFNRKVSDEELETVQKTLENVTVRQRTPSRVSHRRADLIREKHIYETKIKRLKSNQAEMRIYCQGGLYIKELISGDSGRTDPCVARIINVEAKTLELDVLDIVMKES